MLKYHAAAWLLRASHLNWALCAKVKQVITFSQCLF